MAVRLKFVVQKKGEYMGTACEYIGTAYDAESGSYKPQKVGSVEIFPVTSGSDENKAFYAATPSGRCEFGTMNEAALNSLPLGAECLITIEVVPKQSDKAAA